jgi:hypothetical protein
MEEQKYENAKHDPPAGCLMRLFWMMIGNVILLLCAYRITQHQSSVLSIADAFYWTIVGSLLAARYVDIRCFCGTTADGDPATMAHWRRYARGLGVVSTALWLGAHAIAYYGI